MTRPRLTAITALLALLTPSGTWLAPAHAENEQDTVVVGVMRVGLDPVMVDGILVGATLSYVAALDAGRVASPVSVSDNFDHRLQPGAINRLRLPLSPHGCLEPRRLTVAATNPTHRVLATATLPLEVCVEVTGRSPSDWARTSMMAGRPIQLMWSFLRNHRLRRSLSSLPRNWSDIRLSLGYADPTCGSNCAVVLQLLLAVATLDSIIDPRFRDQSVAAPIQMSSHSIGECTTLGTLVDEIEAGAPITDEGRIAALIETLSALVHRQKSHLQCN